MEIIASELQQAPIISMQDGFKIAEFGQIVINPDDGKILGVLTNKGIFKRQQAIPVHEIRQLSTDAIIVADADSLTEVEEIVRIQELLTKNYQLTGATVQTEVEIKLGKVADYSVDSEQMLLHKLFVKGPLKKIVGGVLEISRDNIVRIEPRLVIVRDTSIKEEAAQPATSLVGSP